MPRPASPARPHRGNLQVARARSTGRLDGDTSGVTARRSPHAHSPGPDQPDRRRHRRQRGQGRRVDRPRPRARAPSWSIFPELCVPGYPAEDLYLKRHFLEANRRAVEELARRGRAGSRPWSASPSRPPAAATPATPTTRSPCSPTARVEAVYRKNRLPNYAVFDEQRYFIPGEGPATVEVGGDDGRPDGLRGLSGSRARRPRARRPRARS